jgi:inward rectifier potassium channel
MGEYSSEMTSERDRDLGIGSRVADMSVRRLLNRDGSFNTKRKGLGLIGSLSLYNRLLTMSWPAFVLLLGAFYILANTLFAAAYMLGGAGALDGPGGRSLFDQFVQDFFFSVQTMSTVGYGHIVPVSMYANVLMTMQSMVGLIGLALATGLIFARFSRPTAKIVFSDNAVIAPYRGRRGFEFRIANKRKNEIVDLEAKAIFSRAEHDGGRIVRRFYPLPLERDKVSFFALAWTIVHPIDEESPFWKMTREDCLKADVEILVLLTGMDETFSQTVHARSSYKPDEIIWNARFEDIFNYAPGQGPVSIDVSRIHDLKRLESDGKTVGD